MNILNQISVLKIDQNVKKKWLINLSEELDTKSGTLDTGINMKQILIWCQFVPYVLPVRKIKNTFNLN